MPEFDRGYNIDETAFYSSKTRETQEVQAEAAKQERYVGAKLLAKVGAENKYSHIANKSLEIAKKRKEKIQGNNAERRDYALIERLEKFVKKYGSEGEKRLLLMSINNLITQADDIPESHWRAQEQILRDNGQGRELSNQEKEILTEDIRKNQRESLQAWVDYLGAENSPYPVWFKLYAWEGMSKMGVFDTNKKQYTKRDKTTVAPYPKLNPAALAKVHGVIMDFYGIDQKDFYANGDEQHAEMTALIKSGNFNRLYSKMMLETKIIVPSPENAEDVNGEWVEYLPGDEEKLAAAAEGTPWCVANSGTGKNYLETGGFSGHQQVSPKINRAKFILLHLKDKNTQQLASNACASIRLGTDGKVAEISGLKPGQALEDSIIPSVEEKVKSLPGGEDFLEEFADKKELIRLDKKMKKGETFTREELEFVYEINRPIKTLDTYNAYDPRINEIKQLYSISKVLESGINANDLMSHLSNDLIATHMEDLLKGGVDINDIVSHLNTNQIAKNLDFLVAHQAPIKVDDLVNSLNAKEISENLAVLLRHDADIDEIIKNKFNEYDLLDNIDLIIENKPDFDIQNLIKTAEPEAITRNLDALLKHNVEINMDDLLRRFNTGKELGYGRDSIYMNEVDILLKYEASRELLIGKMSKRFVKENFRELLDRKFDPGSLINKLDNYYLKDSLDEILANNISIDTVVTNIKSLSVDGDRKFIIDLLNKNANTDAILSKLSAFDLRNEEDYEFVLLFLKKGANIEKVASRMASTDKLKTINFLINLGVNPLTVLNLIHSYSYDYDEWVDTWRSYETAIVDSDEKMIFQPLINAGLSLDIIWEYAKNHKYDQAEFDMRYRT